MYNIENLYKSKRFQLVEIRVSGKKETAGILCFRGVPTQHDLSGRTVCAIESGVVTASTRCYDTGSREFRRGRIVEIAGASGIRIAYGRLASADVHEGDFVQAGQPLGVEGCTGAGRGEYLTLEFRRNGRRMDGCALLDIGRECPREWTEQQQRDAAVRLVDANELLTHAVEMTGKYGGSEAAVPVRYILAARDFEGVQ